MNRAVDHNERFLVERNGEPVLILSVTDFVKTLAPPPDRLEKSWDASKRSLDNLSMDDIDAEIAAYRREKRTRKAKPERRQ